MALGFTAIFVFVPTYVMTAGLGPVGLFFLSYGATAVTWRIFFSWIPDRLGPSRLIVPGLAAYSLAMALLAVSDSQLSLVLSGFVAGIAHGVTYPVVLSVSIHRSSESDRGSATAVFSSIFDTGLILAAPVLGLLIVLFGYRTMFSLIAACLLVGLFLVSKLDQQSQQRA
jgi:MFS family permease